MSVAILYYKVTQERISSAQLSGQIANWIEELPVEKQIKINKLHQQDDRVLSLAGLQLLKLAVADLSDKPFSLKQLRFPEQAKPFFDGDFDFNISHSGDIACCIVSNTMKVGIDIELQRDVSEATLNKFLSLPPNTQHDEKAAHHLQDFFKIWTKNEAIIKAANYGSIFNMKDLQLESDGGFYQDQFWYTYPVDIVSADDNKEYTCHMACSEKIIKDELKLITPRQIFEL